MTSNFTSLTDFRRLFATGNPVLTYHQLGPAPRGVRLKGLFVSARLFERQLAELRAGGFAPGSLAECAGPLRPGRVVLTFDDGFASVLRYGLEPLARHQFHAVQFLVGDRLGKSNAWDQVHGEVSSPLMDVAQIRDWLAAGHEIGSHTLTHPLLTKISVALAREEITASKKQLEDVFGRAITHFCYPYGDWNPAVRDLVIAAGYRTASTTDHGVNTAAVSPFELRRITARYRSRSLRNLVGWFRARVAGAGDSRK